MNNYSSSNDPAYQSDHNPVYGYFPKLIDNKYNVAIITYNEKGQTTTQDAVDSFLVNCSKLLQADVVIIGIQEGDSSTVFVNTVINRVSKSTQPITRFSDNNKSKKHPPPTFYSHPILTNPPPAQLTESQRQNEFAMFEPNPSGYENVIQRGGSGTLTEITYKSFGKECKTITNKFCLLNGLYVYIRPNLAHMLNFNPDYGTKTLNSIPFFSKHIAWVCIESRETKSQHVFFSCHLEYNGSVANAPTGFKYPQRKAQLDSYISSMSTKFPDAEFIMCLGDTNMRTLSITTSTRTTQTNTITSFDQMLAYLIQEKPESIRAYNTILTSYEQIIPTNNIDELQINNKTLTELFDCYFTEENNRFYCLPPGQAQNTSIPVAHTSKIKAMLEYCKPNNPDIYAPYCINPSFQLDNTTYRAYDFTYNPGSNQTHGEDLYAYPPTAIYKLTYPREFDTSKREKSGNILAPSHTDRILMFRPVHSISKKINFMLLD